VSTSSGCSPATASHRLAQAIVDEARWDGFSRIALSDHPADLMPHMRFFQLDL